MGTPRKLIVPCIHMNGTSKKDLSDALEAAHDAINAAIDALRKTAPNGRDYYVYDNKAYGIAADQHCDRMKRLESIKEELDAIVGGILDRKKEVEIE